MTPWYGMGFLSTTLLGPCPIGAGSEMLAEHFCPKGCLSLTMMVTILLVTGNLARVSRRRASRAEGGHPRGAAVALCPGPCSQSSAPCRDCSPWGLASSKATGGQRSLSVTPRPLSRVVPFMGAHLLGTELLGALLGEGRNGQEGSSDSPAVPGMVWRASSIHRAVRAIVKHYFVGEKTALISLIAKLRGRFSKPLPAWQIPAMLCRDAWHKFPALQNPSTSGCSWSHPGASRCRADGAGERVGDSDPSDSSLCSIL